MEQTSSAFPHALSTSRERLPEEWRLQKRAMTGMLAFVLLIQPLVLTGYFTAIPTLLNTTDPVRDVRLAQEPGIRIEPQDLTEHVPILINGTADFVDQGWPGSGTEPDPFVIEALNVTYDVGLASIQVINTDAHFVIRDCYANQMSSETAIIVQNVSHCSIEYCTVASEEAGIQAFDTSNTVLSHCDVLADQIAVHVNASSDSTVSWNRMNSTSHRGLTCRYCTGLTLSHNDITGNSPSWYAAYVGLSNHTTVTDEVSRGGVAGYAFYSVIDLSIQNLVVPQGSQQSGVSMYSVEDVSIESCEAHGNEEPGLGISNSDSTIITGSAFSSQESIGVLITLSNHTAM
ncbi:hypothetical protein EU538_11480, partial [Candidatus Thorarchaeota archaeon]